MSSYTYDVFISYSHQDKEWVRMELLPRIEAENLHVCIDYKDFKVGAPIVTEIELAILTSRKVLLIITPAYLESNWANFEKLMLQVLDPANREQRLIPVLKSKCNVPLHIKYLTMVNFTESDDTDFVWTQLLTALGKT